MKNVLVQYQGGGYDGCFWEWNFFFIDKDEKFHDIFSSGREGITNQKNADELLVSGKDHVYQYDITTKKGWEELCQASHPHLVIGVPR